jgi:hypothetical protein
MKKIALLIIALTLSSNLFSQSNGDVFNIFGTLEGTNDHVYAVHTSEDGSSFIGGAFTHFKGRKCGSVVKLTPSGDIDYLFDASQNKYSGRPLVIKEMANGNVLVGTAVSYGAGLYMLNADGSINEDFDLGYGFNAAIFDIALQEDGKIIVVGQFTELNKKPAKNVVRLNQNGSIDNSFNFNGGLKNIIASIPEIAIIVTTVKIDRF